MNLKSALERRRIVRVPVQASASFLVVGDEDRLRDGVATDIGIGGAFIETTDPGPFGSTVRIGIDLGSDRFVVDAVVRWVRAAGMGVQFGLLGVRETHAITELARAHASGAPPASWVRRRSSTTSESD
jgi:hypothetical protein